MTFFDRFLQIWRIRKARPFINQGARVLDIGSVDGVMFQAVPNLAANCIGIDPTLKTIIREKGYTLIPGFFPADMPDAEQFDTITLLAVLEHFPEHAYPSLVQGCLKHLKPGGRIIITVPSPLVDHILKLLSALRLVHGMSLEEHHGYEIKQTVHIFAEPGFKLTCHKRFQLGLNNLFVFERSVTF